MQPKHSTLLDTLNKVLLVTKKQPSLTLGQIRDILADRGPLILLLFFCLPLCIPLQIPGLSIPFGLILASLGVELILGKRVWLPKWILKRRLLSRHISMIIKKIIKGVIWTQKFTHPRWQHLTTSAFHHKLSGSLICLLALLLTLPLPIPATNLLAALPILCLSLSLIEDDGMLWVIGVTLSFLCLIAFGLVLWGSWALFMDFS